MAGTTSLIRVAFNIAEERMRPRRMDATDAATTYSEAKAAALISACAKMPFLDH